MCLSSIPLCGFLLILNLQLFCTSPISPGLSDADIDFFKVLTSLFEGPSLNELLSRLEESVSEVEQSVTAERNLESLRTEEAADEQQPPPTLDEAAIREFLSAKNLKSIRNDSTRKSSSCFGRRMDRIGSMSSLGCNTVGKYNRK
ncbi:natriuretic peptides B isoform X1 [Pseudochaenichthys georgianus]|uniref:natriuretic peptides B isoform X1 n=1 Tax=Pseudochaenichthys georgianus TaxID=52239 RepID=UPI00146EA705|nr:natriuretic peptides B isoform X1 [Pseudochaenichthys georgianus]